MALARMPSAVVPLLQHVTSMAVWTQCQDTTRQQHACGLVSSPDMPASPVLVRYYAADAPEPMIMPAPQQPQKNQPVSLQRQEVELELPDTNRGPWERVIDKASGQPYWWNAKTGVTTPVGASKPDAWVAVVEQGTQAQYYWNKQSGETTAVGEPLPGPEGRLSTASASPWQQQQQISRPGMGSVLANSLAVGFGVGLVFAIIRVVF